MSTREPAPATKHDLRDLESRITKHFDDKLAKAIAESETNIVRHFDLTVEAIRHDLAGANADEIASIRDDIGLIKRHVGLTRA